MASNSCSAGLDARAAEQFRRDADLAPLRCFADLDHGIEWCEERLLQQTGGADAVGRGGLREQLLALLPDAARIDAFLARTTLRELRAGEWLMRAGDESDALFLVESGQFAAQLPRGDGREAVRLQTMHGGTTIGELGFLLGARRSADVVAERDSVRAHARPADLARHHRCTSPTSRARSTRSRSGCSASASCS